MKMMPRETEFGLFKMMLCWNKSWMTGLSYAKVSARPKHHAPGLNDGLISFVLKTNIDHIVMIDRGADQSGSVQRK